MSNLAELTDRVEQVLADTANAIWSTTWIAEGLRQALNEYNEVVPFEDIVTGSVVNGLVNEDPRELGASDLLNVTPLVVREVWYPYEASSEPRRRSISFWRDKDILRIEDGPEPEAGESIRVFMLISRTIEGLDSATSTTVYSEHETILVNGAAGHVAASRGLDLTEQVTIDKLTAQQVRAWGLAKLQEFRSKLREVGQKQASQGKPIIKLPKLDRWDQSGSRWT